MAYNNNFIQFSKFEDNAERISVGECLPNEFIEKFEKPYKPVVILGVQDNWKAKHKWTLEVCEFDFILKSFLSFKYHY